MPENQVITMNSNVAKVAKFSLEKVAEYYKDENYGRAFAYLILCLELDSNNRTSMEDILSNVTFLWACNLEKRDEIHNARFCYNQALRYFPNNLKILNDYASHYYRYKEIRMAFKYIEIAHAVHPQSLSIEKNLQSMYASKVPQWHYRMLNDKIRNEVYKLAIENLLKSIPMDERFNIIDIGTGSGLLSLFAKKYSCEYNQNKVHIVAIEECEVMSQIAHNIFNQNDLKVQLIQSLSTDLSNQRVYNALITEIFDCCLFGEGVLTSLIHAHSELLKENAIILPYSAKLFIFGVESEQLDIKFRFKPPRGKLSFKLHSFIKKVNEDPYDAFSINMFDYKLITSIQEVCVVNFNRAEELKQIYFDNNAFDDVILKVIDSGVCHAFVICFELNLDPLGQYKITTNPLEDTNCVCWEQGVVFPAHSRVVKKDDALHLQINANEDKFQLCFTDDAHISKKIDSDNNLNEANECDCMLVTSDAISLLNFHRIYSVYEDLVSSLNQTNKNYSRILEISSLPLFTIILLHKTTQNIATVVIPEENVATTCSLFQHNQIQSSRVDLIHDISKAVDGRKKYDYIVFDPVLENGLLNETFFKNINSWRMKLRSEGCFAPKAVSLCFELVESRYFEECTQAMDGNLFGFKIASEINKYSVHEMRSLSGNFERRALSSVVKTGIIYDELALEKIITVKTIEEGDLSGFLYWFESSYGNGGDDRIVTIDTKESSYGMAAFVLASGDKVSTTKNGTVAVKVRQEYGLLKISL